MDRQILDNHTPPPRKVQMSNSPHKLSRRTILAGAGAGAATVGAALPFASTAGASAAGDGHGIHVIEDKVITPRLRYLRVSTPALGWNPAVNVLLPEGYDNSGKRYPVIHLYHGGPGTFSDWDQHHHIADLVGGQEVIVVMPDGGTGGWYSNSKIQLLGPRNYETFHIAQLIPFIDQNYRTLGDPAGRAAAGFSMGGFGAMKYAAKYFGHFASVTSISGPTSIRRDFGLVAHYMNTTNAVEGGVPGSLYGVPWDENLVTADNPMQNIERYRGKRVAFYSGDQADVPVPQELQVRAGQEEFSDALNRAGIPHHFGRFQGGHGSHVAESMGAEIPQILGALRRAG